MVVLVLVGVLTGVVQADKLELQVKLGKKVPVQLKDVTIAEALAEIGEKADLEIVLSDEAAWKLPQGAATRLRVMLKGPLVESLAEMLNVFFMRYAVGEEQVTIYPRPELEHILGRPTTRQLELLKDIYTKRIEVYKLEDVQGTINEALGRPVLISPVDPAALPMPAPPKRFVYHLSPTTARNKKRSPQKSATDKPSSTMNPS